MGVVEWKVGWKIYILEELDLVGEERVGTANYPDRGKHSNYDSLNYRQGTRLADNYDHFQIHDCPCTYCHACNQV